MRPYLPYIAALVLLCFAALQLASTALPGPLKPQYAYAVRRRLHDAPTATATAPPPPPAPELDADAPGAEDYFTFGPDYFAPGPGYYLYFAPDPYAYGPESEDYDYLFSIKPLVTAPEAQPPVDPNYQGFKLAFHYVIDPSREESGEAQYVREELMPAVAATLRRSIRVRRPTGPINLDAIFRPQNTQEEVMSSILSLFNASSRSDMDALIESVGDADYFLGVTVPAANSAECSQFLGAAMYGTPTFLQNYSTGF